MEKQPRVLGAFCQRALHLAARLRQLACRRQRPGQSIVSEDITARIKFCSCKSKGSFRRLVSRCEIKRKRPRIAAGAAVAKLSFDLRRFVLTARRPQRLSESPLI